MWIFRYIVKNQLFVKFVRWMDEFTSDPVLLVFNNFSVRSTKNETSKTKERITYTGVRASFVYVCVRTVHHSPLQRFRYDLYQGWITKNFHSIPLWFQKSDLALNYTIQSFMSVFFAAIFCKFLLVFYEPFSILFYSHFAFCVAPFLSSGIFDSPWTCFLANLFVING